MDMISQMTDLARKAKQAGRLLARNSGRDRSLALQNLARALDKSRDEIARANAKDLEQAEKNSLDQARIDRLRITPQVVDSMIEACRHVATLSDPVGEIESMWKRPNGLMVGRMRIPLGVVAIIYESRPNVTIDAAILCLKAGNAVILRGGSEAWNSNIFLGSLLSKSLEESGLPGDAVQIVPTTDREAVNALLGLDEYIDVVIPRGGEGLIRAVTGQATMPVLKHYKGVCHIFVDRFADPDQALDIIYNAKVQRPGVCNALECLLVHEEIAAAFLPQLAEIMAPAKVRFKACPVSLPLLGAAAEPAESGDWGREFLELKMAVRVVPSQDAAQEHIAAHGSGHTEAILTQNHVRAMRFLNQVDASAVMINVSTRFNDGGELGLGAEIGISTSKIHAYGPMGVRELTATKFVVMGQGQIRE
jgi:glutamate-5-semialdehyde dehydrogenase